MLIWLKGSPMMLGVEHGVLKADEVQAVLDARRTISEATALAKSLVEQGERQAKELLAKAEAEIAERRRRGYDEGVQQAVAEWQERILRRTMDDSQSIEALHGRLAEIVIAAVERIVSAEPRQGLYQRALKNVQVLSHGATSLTLRVCPADQEQARAAVDSIAEDSDLKVELAVDPRLAVGSCIFESEHGVLDASLETQLAGLRTAAARAVRKSLSDDEASQAVLSEETAS